jgi:hypothetical protein
VPSGRALQGTVARCYAGGKDLGEAMVAAGWAWAFIRYSLTTWGSRFELPPMDLASMPTSASERPTIGLPSAPSIDGQAAGTVATVATVAVATGPEAEFLHRDLGRGAPRPGGGVLAAKSATVVPWWYPKRKRTQPVKAKSLISWWSQAGSNRRPLQCHCNCPVLSFDHSGTPKPAVGVKRENRRYAGG